MTKIMQHNIFFFQKTRNLMVVFMLGLVYATPANAYLDPGTGSIILQGLIAGVMAVAATAGVFWQKIKLFFASFFASAKSKKTKSGSE